MLTNDIDCNDKIYLSKAFQLAWKGRFTTMPNPNVGCVIVKDNKIVGEGYHVRAGEAHAEVRALNMAGNLAKGATAYITLEPCSHYGRTPPCTMALIRSGIKRVVISMLDPNPDRIGLGVRLLRQAGIVVHYGYMLSEAELINKGFIKRIRTGMPWITLKLASSLDGRSAMSSGESKWITSVQSRQDVQCFRASTDVILSTSATVLMDNPRLNVRWSFFSESMKRVYNNNSIRQPVRVIIDSANRVLPTHRFVQHEGPIILVRIKKDNLQWPESVEQLLISSLTNQSGDCRIHLKELIKYLASYRKINNILVEAGPTLSGSLLDIGLVDELVLYQSTKFLGSNAKPICFLPNINNMKDIKKFQLIDIQNIGPDIRLTLRPCVVI